MENITGKIIWAGEQRSGVSRTTGSEWKQQDFCVEARYTTPSGDYITKIAFSVFGKDMLDTLQIAEGDEVDVSYGINARLYNGRYYNEVKASRIKNISKDAEFSTLSSNR